MLIFVTLSALLLAALGLCAVRTAPAVARWLAMLSVVAFVVVGSLADRTEGRDVVSRFEQARLGGSASDQRTAMLLAAARTGPMAHELELWWEASSRGASAAMRALGAQAVAPMGLPFAPEDVRIRATTLLRVDRPVMFEVEVVGLTGDLPAELAVPDGVAAGFRESVTVGAQPTTVAFTPTRAGAFEVTLHIAVGEHQVRASGAFVVAEPDEILVVDPSGVAAAALRAQGERVRESSSWPTDWREHHRIVLGRALPVEQQLALGRAVDDGTGLFVLAGAFGDEGMPIRELLPVRPLPAEPEIGIAEGPGRAAGDNPKTDPPKDGDSGKPPKEQVKPNPAENIPPASKPDQTPPRPPDAVGDTEGAKPVSKDPVEVDRHSVAMVIVVDRSESMGEEVRDGLTKMSFAKTSALRTAQALDAGDRVGVISFGNRNESRVELPMTDAMDGEAVRAGIEKLADRREYTFLLSAVRQAHAMLRDERVAVKHVVVITDGEFRDQTLALRREASQMRATGKITLSIISIIDDLTQPGFKVRAQQIAREGGGLFLATANASAVPVIVSSEVSRALSRVGRQPRKQGNDGGGSEPTQPSQQPDKPEPDKPEPDKPEPDKPEPDKPEPDKPEPDKPDKQPESPETPAEMPEAVKRLPVRAVTESPLLLPEPEEWPSLGSAVRSVAPLEARVLLVAGDDGWPLLAFVNRGLGRVGAFAAELGGENGREFREAEAFPGWLAQWLAATTCAVESTESRDLKERGEVMPPTTVPADIRWLREVSGSEVAQVSGQHMLTRHDGKQAVEQVAELAPWLIGVLLLLACGERIASSFALRRGRS